MKKQFTGVLVSLLCLIPPASLSAGVHELEGSVKVGTDVRKRIYVRNYPDNWDKISYVVPGFSYLWSVPDNDYFSLRFYPKFNYDFELNETSVEVQDLQVQAGIFFTNHWSLTARNFFQYSDKAPDDNVIGEDGETETTEETPAATDEDEEENTLAEEDGRRKFWTDLSLVETELLYGDERMVRLSGSVDLFRDDSDNEDRGYTEYDKYNITVANEHRFNSSWGTTVSAGYTVGTYPEKSIVSLTVEGEEEGDTPSDSDAADDPSGSSQVLEAESTDEPDDTGEAEKELPPGLIEVTNDVTEYRFGATLTNYFNNKNLFLLKYNYLGADYESDYFDDNQLHEGQLQWQHTFGPRLSTTVGIGPSFESASEQESSFEVNGLFNTTYRTRKGRYFLLFERSYDVENFSGTDERGFVKNWKGQLAMWRRLSRTIAVNGNVKYIWSEFIGELDEVDEETDEVISTSIEDLEKKRWVAGGGGSWYFEENFVARLHYTFMTQDATNTADSYDDHRLEFRVIWREDLLKW